MTDKDKDFFLSPDDAQTLGDIDFMRESKKVKKSFPETHANQSSFEIVTETSSIENEASNARTDRDQSSNTVSNSTSSSQGQPGITGASAVTQTQSGFTPSSAMNQINTKSSFDNANSNKTPEERRQNDDSMDIFRDMAQDITKKR